MRKVEPWEKLHNSAFISKVISKSFNHKIKIILKKTACVPIHNFLIIVCVCVCLCVIVILTTTYRSLGNKTHACPIHPDASLPSCFSSKDAGEVHTSITQGWSGCGAREHFLSLFSYLPHIFYDPPTASSDCLSCLPLGHYFTGLKKILLTHFMGRRHGSNCLKIENFQNKEH